MKAISLHPEHALDIAEGRKWIETRPRRCNYQGRIAVQATLPLGAVVASAVLTDCVPILDAEDELQVAWQPHVAPTHQGELRLWHGPSDTENLTTGRPDWRTTVIEDQRPFGDFTPGRWALLLDVIAPTTERCPACWGKGWSRFASGYPDDTRCWVCAGSGCCDPIPARGQQPVPWNWTPS